MDTREKAFEIRAYGFAELALCYFPDKTKENAAAQFRRWINKSEKLQQQLQHAGHSKGMKILSPKQVTLIVDYFGEP